MRAGTSHYFDSYTALGQILITIYNTCMFVVTGASGLVGANLVRILLDQGQQVRALVHKDRRALEGLEVELVQADLLDPDSLCRAFSGAEIVFHLAGLISLRMDKWEALHTVNVIGTRNVVEACLCSRVGRLVHFSSINSLIQEPFTKPVSEDQPLVDASTLLPYDRSKILGEMEVQLGRQKGLDAVILNPTGILGPNDFKPSYLGQALLMLAKGRLPALVSGGFDWVDARDVALGAVAAANRAADGSRYLLSGHWRSVKEVAAEVARCTGRRPPRIVLPWQLIYWLAPLFPYLRPIFPFLNEGMEGPEPLFSRPSLLALHSNPQVSHARATADLDYHPRLFEQSVKDTLEWFEKNNLFE